MSEAPYVSRSRIEKVEGLHRRGHLEAGGGIDFGVHGPIKQMFDLSPERDLPLPVDYIVASTGG